MQVTTDGSLNVKLESEADRDLIETALLYYKDNGGVSTAVATQLNSIVGAIQAAPPQN